MSYESNGHLKIVVAEGKVTIEELQAALKEAIQVVTKGGCNCGLTGFDLSFLRGDPEVASLARVAELNNIHGATLTGRIGEIAGR